MVLFTNVLRAQSDTIYNSANLLIRKISENAFIHISYLNTNDFGKVACNGMVIAADGEAIVLETPVDDASSIELIRFIEKKLKADIKAVIAHHFHIDCVGGLNAFHDREIPSYAGMKTIGLCTENGYPIPENALENGEELEIGGQQVLCRYFGAAHTVDNIVTYLPSEKLLFGGCMVKALNAGKGNLADADTLQWPLTIRKIRTAYPDVDLLIPGHGPHGNSELLDYTIRLFEDH